MEMIREKVANWRLQIICCFLVIFFPFSFTKMQESWARNLAHLVKRLSYKHEDLIFIPRIHGGKKVNEVSHTFKPST